MFPALIEKLTRREDLTSDEAAAAMAEVMEGRAAEAQIAGAAHRPRDERRAARGDRRPGAHDARARGAALAAIRRRVRHLRHRRRPVRARSTSPRASRSSSPRAASASRSTATARCRASAGSADVFEALGVRVTAPPAVVERCLDEAGIGFFFAPTFHPSMRHAGADAPRARRADGVQPARSADEPGRRRRGSWSACRGRSSPSCSRARCCCSARSARGSSTAPTASTRSRRPATRRCRSAATGRSTRSTCIRPTSGCRRRRRRRSQGGDARRERADHRGAFSPASAAPARDVVLLNAGAALFIAGTASSLTDGLARAAAAIDRGDAAQGARSAGRAVDGRGVDRRSRRMTPSRGRRRPARDDRRRDAAHRRRARRAGTAGAPRAAGRACRRQAWRFPHGAEPDGPRQRHRRVQAPIAVARRAAAGLRSGGDRRAATQRPAPPRSRC